MGYWLTLDNVGIFYMILVRLKGFYGKILHWKPQSNYGKKSCAFQFRFSLKPIH